MRKNVLIIYTGGTIGMVRGEHGYIPSSGSIQEYFASGILGVTEGLPDVKVIEFDPLLDSSDINVADWNKIGHAIADNYRTYDGFIVLHGTDTMAYTASALSFMLEGLQKPVVLTGSQIPFCEPRSDGFDNLINALLFAASDNIREVCICFNNILIRGNRSIKVSSDNFRAFESPNYPHLAECGIQLHYNKNALFRGQNRVFHLQELIPASIGVVKIIPGIQYRHLEPIVTEDMKAIILEAFGVGNIPERDGSLQPLLRKAYENNCLIVVCSQCHQGAVRLGVYENSHTLVSYGALNGNDMTTEATVAKLYYLLSKDLDIEDVRAYMSVDIAGEMSI